MYSGDTCQEILIDDCIESTYACFPGYPSSVWAADPANNVKVCYFSKGYAWPVNERLKFPNPGGSAISFTFCKIVGSSHAPSTNNHLQTFSNVCQI